VKGHGVKTALTELTGVRHPIVQTGMGWVAGPRLVSAVANAGGLGILASATMTLDRLAAAIREVKERTAAPFGVNYGRTPPTRATGSTCSSGRRSAWRRSRSRPGRNSSGG
jgi:NAD(P)H-dependent flavin oxidoreductase YrpB (nitropropane dioxygenase family)